MSGQRWGGPDGIGGTVVVVGGGGEGALFMFSVLFDGDIDIRAEFWFEFGLVISDVMSQKRACCSFSLL